jgi:hypothetical protein
LNIGGVLVYGTCSRNHIPQAKKDDEMHNLKNPYLWIYDY